MKVMARLAGVWATMAMAVLPAVANAQGQNEATNAAAVTESASLRESFTWTTNADKTITITEYTGDGGEVAIPERINGLPVSRIGYKAFHLCTNLTSVTIPASVTSMGDDAFSHCTSLTSVTIPDGVVSIGHSAFYSCTSLTNITILNGVTSIGVDAFDCCNSLTRIMIGSSVTNIGGSAFLYCPNLAAITVDERNPVYSSADGVLFDKVKATLIECPKGKPGNCSIPASVTSIRVCAFRDCISLTNVTIPTSVVSIGEGAFDGCDNLTSVTIPSNVTKIGERALGNCKNLTAVYFKGDAPSPSTFVFDVDSKVTVYHLEGTKGWEDWFGGRPTAVWKPEGGTVTNGTSGVGAN